MEVRIKTATTTEVHLNDADTSGILEDIYRLAGMVGVARLATEFPNLMQLKRDIQHAQEMTKLLADKQSGR